MGPHKAEEAETEVVEAAKAVEAAEAEAKAKVAALDTHCRCCCCYRYCCLPLPPPATATAELKIQVSRMLPALQPVERRLRHVDQVLSRPHSRQPQFRTLRIFLSVSGSALAPREAQDWVGTKLWSTWVAAN